jgi:Reverse transcriptase (RNA-dependent DNA polymerase)
MKLKKKLRIGQEYAEKHAVKAQKRYADYYNSKSSDKHFDVGEQVIYLARNSNQKMFSHWLGPCLILRKKSPHSYVIDVDGVHRTVHVNHLRKFHPSISEVNVNNCAMIFDSDEDFGRILSVDIDPCDDEIDYLDDNFALSCGDENELVYVHPLPSSVITADQLSHLNSAQQRELCDLLDSYSECFSDKPGFCSYIEHHIEISKDFKPKRLREYRIPELMKVEVQRQIDELADDGFIVPSTSPMASPLVCVLKGKDGTGGIRLAIDCKYVNSFTQNDAYVMPNLSDLIHKVGSANFITTTDCRSGYWPVKPEDRWLTVFTYDGGLWKCTRLHFGLRTSGNSFVRCFQMILNHVREFSFSFVDDLSVCSDHWTQHMTYLRAYLIEIRKSGLTLIVKECSYAKPEVKFIGHVIGSGRHRPDEHKLASDH